MFDWTPRNTFQGNHVCPSGSDGTAGQALPRPNAYLPSDSAAVTALMSEKDNWRNKHVAISYSRNIAQNIFHFSMAQITATWRHQCPGDPVANQQPITREDGCYVMLASVAISLHNSFQLNYRPAYVKITIICQRLSLLSAFTPDITRVVKTKCWKRLLFINFALCAYALYITKWTTFKYLR